MVAEVFVALEDRFRFGKLVTNSALASDALLTLLHWEMNL